MFWVKGPRFTSALWPLVRLLLKTLMEVQRNQQSTQRCRLERLAHYFDVSVALRQDENWRMFLTPQGPGTHIKVLLSVFLFAHGAVNASLFFPSFASCKHVNLGSHCYYLTLFLEKKVAVLLITTQIISCSDTIVILCRFTFKEQRKQVNSAAFETFKTFCCIPICLSWSVFSYTFSASMEVK